MKWIKDRLLKRNEKRWWLYDARPTTKIEWLFAFMDQLKTAGHYNAEITVDHSICSNNAIIVVNLNNRVSEETLFHTLNHEAIHVAIHNCIGEGYEFIETVIDNWMMGEIIIGKGYTGNLTIQKIHSHS